MPEIVALLQAIAPVVSRTVLKQRSQVIYGMLISTGRIMMLELSRWTERGGSYRTIQRWYPSKLVWLPIMLILFTSVCPDAPKTAILLIQHSFQRRLVDVH